MKIENLKRGNEIQKEISQLNSAKNSFYWEYPMSERNSKHATLQIQCDNDDGGREINPMPNILNDTVIEFILDTIETKIDKLTVEFEVL
jgi:hypothetical protein